MKITDYKTIKTECKEIQSALTCYMLGLSAFNEKHAQDQIDDYGIAYDTERKAFVPIVGIAPSSLTEKEQSVGTRTFYSLARVKDRYYRKLRHEFYINLIFSVKVNDSFVSSNYEAFDNWFWDFVYEGKVTVEVGEERYKFTRQKVSLEDLVREFERKELGKDLINRLKSEIVDLTKQKNYYVL